MKKQTWLAALAVCLVLATLSPLASSAPDGLETVAGDKGFLGMGKDSLVVAAAGYLFPGIENRALATIMAGWLGVFIMFGLGYGAACLILRLRKARESQ